MTDLHKSNCPSVLPPCTCADPDHPYRLVPERLILLLLDEADPVAIEQIHAEFAAVLKRSAVPSTPERAS